MKALITAMAVAVGASAFAQVTYNDFSSTAGLTLNGSAVQNGNFLRMSDTPSSGESGSAYYNTKQAVTGGFDTTFDFRCFDGSGADGMSFIIQNNGLTQLGDGGGNNSASGPSAPNTISVQFRSFWNDVAIWSTDGTGNIATIADVGFGGLHRDSPWHAHINYDASTFQWTVDLDNTTILTANYDPSGAIAFDSGTAYVGFGSGTGASDDNNDLFNWNYQPTAVPEPATFAALGLGGLVMIRRRKR